MNSLSVPAAAFADLASFLSPCVLPLVPGYLAFISSARDFTDSGAPVVPSGRLDARALAFVAGFSLVFILGASATQIGRLVGSYAPWLTRRAGLVVAVFGLHMIGVFSIPMLYREKPAHLARRPVHLAPALCTLRSCAQDGEPFGLTTAPRHAMIRISDAHGSPGQGLAPVPTRSSS
jgi:cytochrome c biogenesis protein CcdA